MAAVQMAAVFTNVMDILFPLLLWSQAKRPVC